jgi:hypothetical protein
LPLTQCTQNKYVALKVLEGKSLSFVILRWSPSISSPSLSTYSLVVPHSFSVPSFVRNLGKFRNSIPLLVIFDRRFLVTSTDPSRDGAPHAQGSDSDVATASDALATATAGGALVAQYTAGMDSGDETGAAAAAEAAAAHLVSAPPSEQGRSVGAFSGTTRHSAALHQRLFKDTIWRQ